MTISFAALQGLPKPTIIEGLDFAAILLAKRNDLVARFPAAAAFIDLESEPLKKSLEENAYREGVLRDRVNTVFWQTLLAEATGTNLDALAGFYDVIRIALESDDQLRERTVMEIAGRSPGGTAERYRAKALGASATVADAVVWRDATSPLIRVAVFSTAPGGVASPTLLGLVEAALNASNVRMVNDTIAVQSAVTITQAITANVWLLPATPQEVFDDLDADLAAAWALEGGMGFDLTRAWLTARLMRPGVQRVEIVTPTADITVSPHEALALGTITLNDMGREE